MKTFLAALLLTTSLSATYNNLSADHSARTSGNGTIYSDKYMNYYLDRKEFAEKRSAKIAARWKKQIEKMQKIVNQTEKENREWQPYKSVNSK